MMAKVTGRGVRLPRSLLGQAKRVEIRRQGQKVVVTPLPEKDPLVGLGRNPVSMDITDASVNHDLYVYGHGR